MTESPGGRVPPTKTGGRPRRQIVLTLLPDEWDRLTEAGAREERDPYQQARYLVLRALRSAPPTDDERETA